LQIEHINAYNNKMLSTFSSFMADQGDRGDQLRILLATEYLPPFISGIANRCKNLINGYRRKGHSVTVFSVDGSDCDHNVTSITNPFYNRQRYFYCKREHFVYRQCLSY
jgi:hypothetical protein